eukprot:m.52728 g.52728  ORF g.52728 m.52728 type:complete len:447 (+) comp10813_c0_seq2:160-1500(+)
MEFTDVYQQSGRVFAFSPNGKHFAYRMDHRVIVRDVETMGVLQLKVCLDKIQTIEWSSDSMYFLCGLYNRGIVQVWSLEDAEWSCKIDEGSAGLTHARWSPDGRHILTTADFQLRITIWSLISQQINYLLFPKFSGKSCAFSSDGVYMAAIERRDCKDCVSIFACKTWEMVKSFIVGTSDACSLQWSPDDSALCVVDSLLHFNVFAYKPNGQLVGEYSAYQNALGVKTATWSPSSQFLAIGSYDECVRLMNAVTWKPVSCHKHTLSSSNRTGSCFFYKESETRDRRQKGEDYIHEGGMHVTACKYEILSEIPTIESIRSDPESASPRLGVGVVRFSPDSKFLATRNDNMPTAVWIWDMTKLKLCNVLIQISAVKALAWHPQRSLLAIATGSSCVYMWSPQGCLSAQVPTDRNFCVNEIEWTPDGSFLLLLDKDRFCLCMATAGSNL